MKHDKFVIAEITANSSNGKTSAGKTIGIIISIIGLLSYISGIIFFNGIDLQVILYTSSGLVFFGSALIMGKIIKPTTFSDYTEQTNQNETINEEAH